MKRVVRQIGDHDIGGFDKAADDLASLRAAGFQGQAALGAVHLHEHRARSVVGDRHRIAVVIAAGRLDPDHVGAIIGEQRRAIGSGDITAEIQYPDPF
jgi:hypothetical protein